MFTVSLVRTHPVTVYNVLKSLIHRPFNQMSLVFVSHSEPMQRDRAARSVAGRETRGKHYHYDISVSHFINSQTKVDF